MTDATAVALAASANAQAAAAAQEAREAHRTACLGMMPTFRDAGATVEQRQAYAECVDIVYPRYGEIDPAYVKGAIILAALGLIAGAVWGWRDERDVVNVFMSGAMGAFAIPCLGLAVLATAWAVGLV